ncbi:DUF2064 domain-containing protein [Nocardioides sp.]|uniref:TIGR04282 family arsenosugar biosynthesis glycosyltransferase n=1 Tax=Nocardioides sp. TaxID=35761 RepID=UPI003563FF24
MSTGQALVVAKAPAVGEVKTRLGAAIGMAAAAEIAAASLLDTLAACRAAFGVESCHLALAGDLAHAVRRDELATALAGWTLRPQLGADFAERLMRAHLDLVDAGGPVLQIGMDTPQVTPDLLLAAAGACREHDAVLGPAPDGGWWLLGVRDPRDTRAARALMGVPMSTPTTYADTRRALLDAGLDVGGTGELADVDTVEDAEAVAGLLGGGEGSSRFARAWDEIATTRRTPPA